MSFRSGTEQHRRTDPLRGSEQVKKVLFIVRSAPYGTAAIPESVRACLGFATMTAEINYLLMDDGVWALMPDQQAGLIGAENTLEMIRQLDELGVALHVQRTALQERNLSLEEIGIPITALSPDGISKLIATVDAVITY